MSDFPASFLWGTASCSYQTEGGNTNTDWYDWEHNPDSPTVEPCGDAIDHWHRYDEDFALLASLGHNAHRMSVEWARIEPAEGEFSQAALNHYRRVLGSLADRGLTAFVTLYHFTLPRWFAARGGWLAPDAVDVFERYVARVSAALGDLMPYASPINEPQVLALSSYGQGSFPPGKTDPEATLAVNDTMMRAHRRAVGALRAGKGSPLIGSCQQLIPFEPVHPDDEGDVGLAGLLDHLVVESHLADLGAGGDVGDWVGLQYYGRAWIDSHLPDPQAPAPAGAETTLGMEVYPAGFEQMLGRLAGVGLPVVVTENGMATDDDTRRVCYLAAHLEVLRDVLAAGVDVRGYLYWTAFDNFEWEHGYEPHFGLVGIDRADNLRRVVKPSAVLLGEVARTGSLAPLVAAT